MAAGTARCLLRRLAQDRSGHVAIVFAMLAVPVIGIASAAIDFGRAAKVRSTLQTAASSAAQAASGRLDELREDVEKEAKAMLAVNLPHDLRGLPARITISDDRKAVTVALETTVPTTLMGVMGITELAVEATGFARKIEPQLPDVPAATAGQPGGGDADAIGRGLAGIFRGGAAGAGGAAAQPAEIEAAVQQVGRQLREMQQSGQVPVLPPEAAAEVERLFRELATRGR